MQRRPLLLGLLGLLATLGARNSFALYDAAPNPLLSRLPGSWRGTLTYRDWGKAERLVTLPCRMHAALLAPSDLSLYFVFDDGPGKTVYSYDRWLFDFTKGRMVWASGDGKEQGTSYRIVATSRSEEGEAVVLVNTAEGKTYRQTLQVSTGTLKLEKVEIAEDGREVFRNGYDLSRADA